MVHTPASPPSGSTPPTATRRRFRTLRHLATIVVVAALALVSCSDGDEAGSDQTENAADTTASSDPAPTAPTSTAPASTAPTTTEPTTTEPTSGDRDPGALVPASCANREAGAEEFVSDAGGPEIQVRVFVPPGAGDRPLPVVLNWHGLGSNGSQQALLSAYENLAEDEGFLAVHPTGASAVGASANSWELAQFDVPGRDDLAMVDDVIDRLVTDFCADPARVYSTGLSNGGFFTALLVCRRADRIAAAASIAGVSHPDDCQPSRPVPFIAFHGTDDDVVTFDGGRSSLETGPSNDVSRAFFDQSMPDEFAEFAAGFGCQLEPEPTVIGDEVTRNDYLGCQDDVPLSFYEIAGGGHTWPGSALGPLLSAALGRTTDEVDATVDGWAFMSQFSLPAEDG